MKITTEQRARIVERYRAGEDAAALAAEHGLSVGYVRELGARPGMMGFKGMADRARQREIASMGGRRGHELGRAHEFTTEEAREAGRMGGEAVSRDRDHMAEIGRVGGRKSGGRKR